MSDSLFEIAVARPVGEPVVYIQELTYDEWRKVFLGARWSNLPVVWIQPAGEFRHRVTFEENASAPKFS